MKSLKRENMVKLLGFSFFLLFSFFSHTSPLKGEELPAISRHGIGLAIGMTPGFGVAYRAFFDLGLGYQFILGALGTSSYFNVHGSAQFIFKIYQPSPNLHFYGLIGSGFLWKTFSKDLDIIPGIGAGIEFNLFKGLAASLDISPAPMVAVARPQNNPVGYMPIFWPGISVVYYF